MAPNKSKLCFQHCPSDPSFFDYLDATYHEDQDNFPFYGENINTENLKDLLKETENPIDGVAKTQPRTSTTTMKPTIRKETKMTKERRGMLEVTFNLK